MKIRMHSLTTTAAVTTVMVLLAGCGTTKLPEQAATTPSATRTAATNTAPAVATPATPSGTAQSRVASVDLANPGGRGAAGTVAGAALVALPSQRVVYFDFDSYVIKGEFQPVLDGHAKFMTVNKGKRLAIEGHADERGGREYNLALGQKRAGAVLSSLKLLGANDSQMEAVSFGEERPAATGQDEQAWAKNRRAELKDR